MASLILRSWTIVGAIAAVAALQAAETMPEVSNRLLSKFALVEKIDEAVAGHILFLAHKTDICSALQLYQKQRESKGQHDFSLLRNIALIVIERNWHSNSPEMQLMALFGAAIAMDDATRYVLDAGLCSSYPQLQFIALHLLAQYPDEEAEKALFSALHAENLLLRCEAIVCLARKQHARATSQIDSLYRRMPAQLHPMFPSLYAMSGDRAALAALRRLLAHPCSAVRVEAIRSLAEMGRDDLLADIRQLLTQHDIAQQEACCFALGILKDSLSLPKLRLLCNSQEPSIALAALLACYRLGDSCAAKALAARANRADLFAINALQNIPESNELLASLLTHEQQQVRINAAIALLAQQDKRCIEALKPLFFCNASDQGISSWTTPGKTLKAWKIAPSTSANWKQNPLAQETSLALREQLLIQTALLPQESFLLLANELLISQQGDLIPTLAYLLQENSSPEALSLLRHYQSFPGAPLLRAWSTLMLYRTGKDPATIATLGEWIKQHCSEEMIRFRTFIPSTMRESTRSTATPFQLTLEERSRLLIEILEAFAQARDEAGVDLLLYAIAHGHPHNRAALAGLLLRATQ